MQNQTKNNEMLIKRWFRYSIGALSLIVLFPFFFIGDTIGDTVNHMKYNAEQKKGKEN